MNRIGSFESIITNLLKIIISNKLHEAIKIVDDKVKVLLGYVPN